MATGQPIDDLSDLSIAELVSLKGKTALITGGAMGLGFATARRFAEAGCSNIFLADMNVDLATEKAAKLAKDYGISASALKCDVTKTTDIVSAVNAAVEKTGRLDVCVNSAGIYPYSPIVDMDDETLDRVLAINIRGSTVSLREEAKAMIKLGNGGVIITLSSTAGVKGIPNAAIYAASKWAIIGLTKSAAIELGPHRIRVVALGPTRIMTEGVVALNDPAGDQARAAKSPLRRLGVPDDVARCALFAACGLGGLVTGSIILADAGDAA